MSFMLRSDIMTYCNMYVQVEAAYETLSHLGEMSCVQFLDATPELNVFQRSYVSELCRCAELERKLGIIYDEMIKDDIYVPKFTGDEPRSMPPSEINTYESMIEKWEEDIQLMAAYESKLLKNHQDLAEMHYVLNSMGPLLGHVELRRESLFGHKGASGDGGIGGSLFVRTGVVNRSKCFAFETMLWRISRGNIYFRTAPNDKLFEDPANSGTFVRKVAFLAVCQGQELSTILEKICTGFRANMYPCPRTYADRQDMLNKLVTRLEDLDQVFRKSKYYRCKALKAIGKLYNLYMIQVKKAKAIYHTMNQFNMDITRKCLIGWCWVPRRDLYRVQDTLNKSSHTAGSSVPSFITEVDTIEPPPTFHRNNKFTRGFQALISAYGDSAYRELNPGLYTLITFPFLFAVMFGDFGHGLLLFAFGLWMVANEKKFTKQNSTNEIWNIFFGGRYVILLMSMFTLFTGFCYNDYFAKPLKFGPNYWINQYTQQEMADKEHLLLDPAGKTGTPYWFGKDPAWSLAKNKILNENSLKMKMSIVLGIIHMIFGLCLSLCNHIFFKHAFAIWLQFIPEIVFLICLFGWLVFLIFWKWLAFSAKNENIESRPGCAPLILIHFIDMCLMRETKSPDVNCKAYFFSTQHLIQQILLIVALLCVPVLLLGTPIYETIANKKKKVKAQQQLKWHMEKLDDRKMDRRGELLELQVQQYSQTFSELMIHQAVHTIEFVLSCISHTASYLRLWALSLAHGQLSEMLWLMLLSKNGLRAKSLLGSIKLFVVFAVWATFSLAILVVMEGLSAFLHTLRLHWVEFMSKFYSGGGYMFHPFSFREFLHHDYKEDKSVGAVCKKGKVRKLEAKDMKTKTMEANDSKTEGVNIIK